MKIKVFAIILLSAVIGLAQTDSQNGPSTANPQTNENASAPKAAGSCCKAMAQCKDEKTCCHHDSATTDSKQMSCCNEKQGMSCMKDETAKSAESCCAKSDQKDCCKKAEKTTVRTAMVCCGGSANQCGMKSHDHADLGK
jgi:hypothetical protein